MLHKQQKGWTMQQMHVGKTTLFGEKNGPTKNPRRKGKAYMLNFDKTPTELRPYQIIQRTNQLRFKNFVYNLQSHELTDVGLLLHC